MHVVPNFAQEFRKLEYYCKNCDYVEDSDPREWCVYISETTFSSKDKTVIVQVGPRTCLLTVS